MRQEIDIDQLMAETWLTVTMLKKGAVTHNGNALYDKCVKQVESVREALERAGYDDASVDHICYAQCALLDETVMSRKIERNEDGGEVLVDEGQMAWRRAPLQARFFGSLRAGEALWDRIAEVLHQPAPNMAVLTCYHRVISLGFQGLYSLKSISQTQRDEVVKALSERVSPPDAALSLVVYRVGKHRWSLIRSRVIRLAYVVLTVIARFWCAATSYGAGKPRCALNSPPPVIGFSYYPAG
ncbi:type VI secretion system protein TssL, short form [Atlantibacter hermannii]|uniref:type VI secretion system protein TssL, short form n=2 Tax=Atlantibacter hermannii TaxID=565 RepID=UPI000ED9042A|nr:type VI secretion system protein TssL, short form [Atlantibacter hermannii]HAP83250.1 DotU family type IV/VI secretion system protein [Enterobacteriaceae bacterium]